MRTTILFFLLFTLSINQQTKAQCHIDDWTALKALYDSADGDNWRDRTGWGVIIDNQTSPPTNCDLSELHGILLNDNNRVVSIDLFFDYLEGSIPSELGNLINLVKLDLSTNNLSGNIPPELGNLVNLIELDLGGNNFSGSLPSELSNLNNLLKMSMRGNQLSGNIPPELGNLSSLEVLYLYRNQFSGNIPPELGNLSSLEKLFLEQNQFSGSIPPELGNLSNLEDLYINRCELIGSIPPELGNLNNLARLHLAGNQLSGSIPPELGNLNNLFLLEIFNNQLTGNIPPELANLNRLIYLGLSDNQLVGSIPPEFGNLVELTYLRLFNNQLNGCYPNGMSLYCQAGYNLNYTNETISDGNNFDASWEEYCNAGVSACETSNCNIDDYNTININPGWNLISLSISPDNNNVSSVFSSLQPDNLEYVTGFNNGTKVFSPDNPSFLNTLTTIEDGLGYWVKVQNADVLTSEGVCLDHNFRKPLNAGWNLVAYPPLPPETPATYFADLINTGNLEFVTAFDKGTKTFDPNGPSFLNTILQMKNGFGYWVKVTNATANKNE